MTTWYWTLPAAASVLLFLGHVVVVLVVLARDGLTPTVRLAWLFVVLLFPVAGPILYFRFGRTPQIWNRRRRQRLRSKIEELADAHERPAGDAIELRSPELEKGATLILAGGGFAPSGGNLVTLYGDKANDDSNRALLRLEEDIEEARESCHLLFYIYLDDDLGRSIAAALVRAVERGVVCRLMIDALGSRPFLRSRLCQRLRDGGVEVAVSLPIRPWQILMSRADIRNHRKIAVIDGRIGWTGSQNLADSAFAPKKRYAPWVDIFVRVQGPAVHDLQRIFVEDWLLDTNDDVEALLTPRPQPIEGGVAVQILPTGPEAHGNRPMQQLSQLGFLETDHELLLTTPYFAPDEATLTALLTTARSGVETMLVLPARNDSRLVSAASRGYYRKLLEAGVEIYEFTSGLLHAKTFTLDRTLSIVATANLDRRSFELNYEVSMVVLDPVFTNELRELQLEYIAASQRVDADRWKNRPFRSLLWENFAGLLAPLI